MPLFYLFWAFIDLQNGNVFQSRERDFSRAGLWHPRGSICPTPTFWGWPKPNMLSPGLRSCELMGLRLVNLLWGKDSDLNDFSAISGIRLPKTIRSRGKAEPHWWSASLPCRRSQVQNLQLKAGDVKALSLRS